MTSSNPFGRNEAIFPQEPTSDESKRKAITEFISSLKSRQEFVPLVGKHVDKTNNTQHRLLKILKVVYDKAVFPEV